jgi:hypothetical protein
MLGSWNVGRIFEVVSKLVPSSLLRLRLESAGETISLGPGRTDIGGMMRTDGWLGGLSSIPRVPINIPLTQGWSRSFGILGNLPEFPDFAMHAALRTYKSSKPPPSISVFQFGTSAREKKKIFAVL